MRDATGTSSQEWAVWRAFLAAQAEVMTEIDRRLRRAHDLGQGEYGALAALREAPGRRLRTKDLAVLLGWERSRTSHLVARMEARGLVRREDRADDARATDLVLTARGARAVLGAARDHAADLRALFVDQMDAHERDVLTTVLTRVVANVRRTGPAGGTGTPPS